MKKVKKKKGPAAFLIILMLLMLPFGCSDDNDAPDPGSADLHEQVYVSAEEDAASEEDASSYEDLSQVETQPEPDTEDQAVPEEGAEFSSYMVSAYNGYASVPVNGNVPFFKSSDITAEAFERYSELDSLGRCGTAFADVCTDIMPTEKRESIGMIKPSGWHTVTYPDLISDRYLYNRCHLIAFELAGENANEKNLITGTRYMNVKGMLPYENKVADYVKSTGQHVLYRVTPDFQGDELVARGVLIEAMSVEDRGEGLSFCVYCYNVQPGINIDYATGDSCVSDEQ